MNEGKATANAAVSENSFILVVNSLKEKREGEVKERQLNRAVDPAYLIVGITMVHERSVSAVVCLFVHLVNMYTV